MESVIQEVGIWNPEDWNPEFRGRNPESNTPVDSVTWGDRCNILSATRRDTLSKGPFRFYYPSTPLPVRSGLEGLDVMIPLAY